MNRLRKLCLLKDVMLATESPNVEISNEVTAFIAFQKLTIIIQSLVHVNMQRGY